MNALGWTNGGYCDARQLQIIMDENPSQFYAFFPERKVKSVAGLNALRGVSFVSSAHCQQGQEGIVYKIVIPRLSTVKKAKSLSTQKKRSKTKSKSQKKMRTI
jgi:hypothetical protein